MSEVANRIQISGPDENFIFHTILNGGNDIDFNNIIPIPPDVYMGDITQEALHKYGERNWFDWCQRNWSVKTNPTTYESIPDKKIIFFTTEWNTPFKIWEKISKQFPTTKIRVMYSNTYGDKNEYLIYKNGSSTKNDIKDEFSFSAYVWGFTDEEKFIKKIQSEDLKNITDDEKRNLIKNMRIFLKENASILY